MLPEQSLQRLGAERIIVGNHLDDSCEVGKEVSLVLVGEDCRHAGIVELDLFVVDLNKVNSGMSRYERDEGTLNLG